MTTGFIQDLGVSKNLQLKPELEEGINGKIEFSKNLQFHHGMQKNRSGSKNFDKCSDYSSGISAMPISYQGAGDLNGEISYDRVEI